MKKPGLFLRDRFLTVSYELSFPDLPEAFDGFSLLFLSDLHGKSFGTGNEDLIRGIVSAAPDAVVFGGDSTIVRKRKMKGLSAFESLLQGIAGRFPLYHAEGNHEVRMIEGFRNEWESLLEKYSVTQLKDGTAVIRRGEEELRISGLSLPETYFRNFRKEPLPEGFIETKLGEKKGFTVLLVHSPAYFDEAAAYGAELTLSGHYHGGTVRLGKRGLMTPDFVFFEKRVQGLFELGKSKLIVSAGLGTHSVNLRVGDPPELVKIVLRKTK